MAPKSLTAAEIRRTFVEFFVAKCGHTDVPSSPVVPHEDPTLLFTNAGMNQFKDVFLGRGKRTYTRAVNTQKCIRAGGKHNDLEDVGKDTYHHTFFEMLGNWSFGDYFKKESISWGWELLTKVYGLDPSRLYVTWFEGNASQGLEPDHEARDLWLQFLPADHVLPGNMKDNFWEMGETGPCGPCSEIHFDRIGGRNAAKLVNSGDPDVLEIWNHVFIQFNREADRSLKQLPAKHVDTGMGLERLVSVLQDKRSNYDTDVFSPIFAAIQKRTGARPYSGSLTDHLDIAYRVVADHIRCLTVAISDGAAPSNEGRGYVLRRILRRAVRHGHQTLGVHGPFLRDLVPVVVETLGPAFPGLAKNVDKVRHTIEEEEVQFGKTLERGLQLFSDAARKVKSTGGSAISAEDAFRLHDTWGFPVDLTQVMAEEAGLSVDVAGYEHLMEEAREKSRAAAGGDEGLHFPPDAIATLERQNVNPTNDSFKFDGKPVTATVLAIWNGKNFDHHASMSTSVNGDRLAVILDRTCCYATMGGQVGDTGTLRVERTGATFTIEDTQRVGPYVLHLGTVTMGKLNVNDDATVSLDRDRRESIRSNHTTTHLVNWALRETLGDEIDQKGSLVDPEKLRFDFSFNRGMTFDEIAQVEALVNERIRANLPVHAEEAPVAAAKLIKGLRAVFGERYPDPVRVVSIGPSVGDLLAKPDSDLARAHSVEFCGGTHLAHTGDARSFAFLSEGGLAAGVRRLTGVTGGAALAAEATAKDLLQRAHAANKLDDNAFQAEWSELTKLLEHLTVSAVSRAAIEGSFEHLRERAKTLRKAAEGASRDAVIAQAKRFLESHGGGPMIATLEQADAPSLLAALDMARARHPDLAFLFLSPDEDGGKIAIAAACPKEAIAKGLKAGDWVKVTAQACGGNGGGKPDIAQAGGKDPAKLLDAVRAAREFAASKG
ncbi:MAG: alanine--tRNA ligase [Phycisphaerae bacterium]|jgi:alanyl-tRNA synthetase|nr:alanine--tRNA ligase [Phycisphaerae bacterium]